MPKVTINSKGAIQSAGSGLVVETGVAFTSSTTVSADASLDATTFLTTAVAAFTNDDELVLPATAETGALKLILSDSTNNVVLKATNAQLTSDVTMTNIGDMCWCVFNGTEWIVGRSLT